MVFMINSMASACAVKMALIFLLLCCHRMGDLKRNYRTEDEQRGVWTTTEVERQVCRFLAKGWRSQYRRHSNISALSPSQPFQDTLCPSCLLFTVSCPGNPLVCPCSLVCPYRDYIRINGTKQFWFCSSKKVHIHRF